jgi:PIN domain nuclease of toxin-antitoxin system
MKLLLDTHVFLWYVGGDRRLPDAWRRKIESSEHVSLSAVSIWETIIKAALGKLQLPKPVAAYLHQQRIQHGIEFLAIDEQAFSSLEQLPPLHADPFDRMIVAQSLYHDLTLVTVDAAVLAYGVKALAS